MPQDFRNLADRNPTSLNQPSRARVTQVMRMMIIFDGRLPRRNYRAIPQPSGLRELKFRRIQFASHIA
jgi:hypothetical protein